MTRISLLLFLAPLTLAGCATDGGGKGNADTSASDDGGGVTDEDQDGFNSEEDCNDDDATVNPGATEICDGIDNDCDGNVDEDVTTTFYRDADGDGFGNSEETEGACERPTGYVPNGNDCDDALADAYPGNPEVCDNIDNNCDGNVDEGVTTTYYADTDADGYGDPATATDSCSQPVGYVTDNTDCDDTTAASFPGNLEICDEHDNDCDGTIDEGVTTTYYADLDADSFGDATLSQEACALPTGYAEVAGDCDDSEATTNPDALEYCDGHDDDCDGDIDEADSEDASAWYADTDTDSFGDPAVSTIECYQPTGYVADNTDCDDTDAAEYPGATEVCDGDDDDCDGIIDEDDAADASDWYADTDSDTYGDPAVSVHQCAQPTGYVLDATDCNDTTATAYPGADEYCDGIDNDCDTYIDEDGEVLDGDTFYADTDTDGTGDPDSTIVACTAPSGYVDNAYDCNDADASEPVVTARTSGSASGAGTIASPLDTLQEAIDRAAECVIAFAGTYQENIDFDGNAVDVWGVEGSGMTYIDSGGTPCDGASPEGCDATVTMASSSSAAMSLRGFTITGGTGHATSSSTTTTCADSSTSHGGIADCTVTVYEYCGGGIYIDGDDPSLSDLIIIDNTLPEFEQYAIDDGCAPGGTSGCGYRQTWTYSYGGGVCAKNSALQLDQVDVFENYADQGGGMYLTDSASATWTGSWLAENEAGDGGAINVDGATLSGTNMVIAFNGADTDGGGLFTQNSGSTTLTNLDVAHNASASGTTRGDAIYSSSGTSVTVANVILHGTSTNFVVYAAGTFASTYSDVYNASTGGTLGGSAAAGTGDISSNPYWVSVTDDGNYNNDDFALGSSSAAIDAGDPSLTMVDVDGSTNDMGSLGGPGGDWL
jgi:hypothetical protein